MESAERIEDEPLAALPDIVAPQAVIEWPVLEHLLDPLAGDIASRFEQAWGLKANVSRMAARPGRIAELAAGLPAGALVGELTGAQRARGGLISIDTGIVFAVFEFVLGNRDATPLAPPPARRCTPFEASVMRPLAAIVLDALSAALAPAAALRLSLARWLNEGEAAADGPAVAIALRLQIRDAIGEIHLHLPVSALGHVNEALGGMFRGASSAARWRNALEQQVVAAHVELCAILHRQTMPLSAIAGLKPGGQLVFDCRSDPTVALCSGDIRVAEGRLGHAEGRIAIRLETTPLARKDRNP